MTRYHREPDPLEAVLEIRINVVLLTVLAGVWFGLRAHSPGPVLSQPDAHAVGGLEGRVAADPADRRSLATLTDAYLEAGHPELAIVVLRAADPALLQEPAMTYQLARAYENAGRLQDALATADLALTRCARVLGARALSTAVPSYGCNERIYSKIDVQRLALERMVQWGIVDPRVDPRADRAYEEAMHKRRVVINATWESDARVE